MQEILSFQRENIEEYSDRINKILEFKKSFNTNVSDKISELVNTISFSLSNQVKMKYYELIKPLNINYAFSLSDIKIKIDKNFQFQNRIELVSEFNRQLDEFYDYYESIDGFAYFMAGFYNHFTHRLFCFKETANLEFVTYPETCRYSKDAIIDLLKKSFFSKVDIPSNLLEKQISDLLDREYKINEAKYLKEFEFVKSETKRPIYTLQTRDVYQYFVELNQNIITQVEIGQLPPGKFNQDALIFFKILDFNHTKQNITSNYDGLLYLNAEFGVPAGIGFWSPHDKPIITFGFSYGDYKPRKSDDFIVESFSELNGFRVNYYDGNYSDGSVNRCWRIEKRCEMKVNQNEFANLLNNYWKESYPKIIELAKQLSIF